MASGTTPPTEEQSDDVVVHAINGDFPSSHNRESIRPIRHLSTSHASCRRGRQWPWRVTAINRSHPQRSTPACVAVSIDLRALTRDQAAAVERLWALSRNEEQWSNKNSAWTKTAYLFAAAESRASSLKLSCDRWTWPKNKLNRPFRMGLTPLVSSETSFWNLLLSQELIGTTFFTTTSYVIGLDRLIFPP